MVLGHEASGVVEAVGEGVHGFEKGDRVAMEPGVSCGKCSQCRRGRYNLCPHMRFFASPPVNGALCRLVTHDASLCFKLPNHVTLEEGAMLEPLSVGVHACRRANLTGGQRVLILGSGPIGLMCLLTARAMGASCIVTTDIDDRVLAMAKEQGADHTVNVKGKSAEEAAQLIRELFGEVGPEVSIECTGVASAIETGIKATQSGGVLVLVGMGAARADLPILEAAVREVDIRGVFRYVNCYPTALELVSSGRVDLKPLRKAAFRLEETHDAFKKAQSGEVTKVLIYCGASVHS